jgi:translation initiation factor IF-3
MLKKDPPIAKLFETKKWKYNNLKKTKNKK